MQKLSKKLVKELIYELINKQNVDVEVKGDDKGKMSPKQAKTMLDAAEDSEDVEITEKTAITQETVKNIIRQEVKAYHEAK